MNVDPRELLEIEDVEHVPKLSAEILKHVMVRVVQEVSRQDELARAHKFGGTHILPGGPDHARLGVLGEEFGEVCRVLNEAVIQPHPSYRENLYKELIQTAACAVAWAVAIDEGRP